MIVLLYTEQFSPRLKYVADILLRRMLDLEVQITHDAQLFKAFEGPKINYSVQEIGGISVNPCGLLHQMGVRDVQPAVSSWRGMVTLYPGKGDIPFDIFGGAFFLLTRYEEYLPHRTDKHGRFVPEESLAWRGHFLDRPLVDEWSIELLKMLNERFGPTEGKRPEFSYLSTIDIDSAFAYRYKGLMRMLGGFLKDIRMVDIRNFRDRLMSVLRLEADPFDTYSLMHSIHTEHGADAIFFFLLADYGHNDKAVSYRSTELQKLIRRLGDYYRLGIHPGFQSNRDERRLKEEMRRLRDISRREVERSRQHFLMLSFPETYRRLVSLGIKEDYSMGYAPEAGFRASTCTPFPFYDIEAEKETTLMIHPFAVMDATLNVYLGYSPDDAILKVKELEDKVRAVGGQFITLWHNESLSEKWNWKGWQEVYRQAVASGSAKN
ncbi:MAG: hypothetical protein RL226_1513 [Bacteroidota bacterium]